MNTQQLRSLIHDIAENSTDSEDIDRLIDNAFDAFESRQVSVVNPSLVPSPNWQYDYEKLLALVSTPEGYEEDGWCLHGFHPKKGHCLIGRDYSFDRDAEFGYSVVFKNEVAEFDVPKTLVAWCESERIWFLDPRNAYTMISDDND